MNSDGVNGTKPLPSLCSVCVGGWFDGHHERFAQLAYFLIIIGFWMCVAGTLHYHKWYWTL